MPTFSAVLLAGGQSRRMGRDKALLPMSDFDALLWQRQLRVLEELQPETIFWSGAVRPGLPRHLRIVTDEVENAGPLAGISACLDLLPSELLVVLAIDLPNMTAPFLKDLLARSSPSRGVVVRHGDYFEPLAAIYPKGLQVLATEHLKQRRLVMQDFVREAVKRDLLLSLPLEEGEIDLFKNLNSPSDLIQAEHDPS